MRERWILLTTTLGFSILFGCTGQRPRQNAETPSSPAPARSEEVRPERPATKRGTIILESDPEPITLKLFDSASASLPLAFTTYIPEDMNPEPAGSGTQKAIRFVANFGGHREREAYMEVLFYPADTTESAGKSLLQGADSSKEKPAADKRFKWSLTERDIVSVSKARGRIVGVAALGRHGDRLFQVTLQYPEEFAEGFNPRARRILEEWRWSDTNQGL